MQLEAPYLNPCRTCVWMRAVNAHLLWQAECGKRIILLRYKEGTQAHEHEGSSYAALIALPAGVHVLFPELLELVITHVLILEQIHYWISASTGRKGLLDCYVTFTAAM